MNEYIHSPDNDSGNRSSEIYYSFLTTDVRLTWLSFLMYINVNNLNKLLDDKLIKFTPASFLLHSYGIQLELDDYN